MDKERKHEKKPRITLGDLVVVKDPKGGFGRMIHNKALRENERSTPLGGSGDQESRSSN